TTFVSIFATNGHGQTLKRKQRDLSTFSMRSDRSVSAVAPRRVVGITLLISFAQICHTTPMPYLTRAREVGTLRPWLTTAVGSPSAEEYNTDATSLYLRSYSPAQHQSAGDHRVLSADV